jgi:hypothetical protein
MTQQQEQQQQQQASAAAGQSSGGSDESVSSSLLQLLEGLQESLQPLTNLADNSSSSSSSSTWTALSDLGQSVQQMHNAMHQMRQLGDSQQQVQLGRLRVALRAVYQQQLPQLACHQAAVDFWLQVLSGMPQVRWQQAHMVPTAAAHAVRLTLSMQGRQHLNRCMRVSA